MELSRDSSLIVNSSFASLLLYPNLVALNGGSLVGMSFDLRQSWLVAFLLSLTAPVFSDTYWFNHLDIMHFPQYGLLAACRKPSHSPPPPPPPLIISS